MSTLAQDWLPPGAASGGLLKPALQSVLDAWCSHWFASRTFDISRTVERGAFVESEGWLRHGRRTAVRAPKPSSARLTEAALDLRLGATPLTERDRDLLGRLGEVLIEDLCARIEAVFGIDDTTVLPEEVCGWLEVSIAEGVGPDLFWLALPTPVLAKACRNAAGGSASRTPLASLKTSLAEVFVVLEATIGRVAVSMPDMAGLEPGDVLVLSTPIDRPIEVSLLGSTQVFARARLADQDGELALAFQS